MTLCVAWRFERTVSFASDSMVGTTVGQSFDLAVKLFAIPVVVVGAIDAQTGVAKKAYTRTIALCYSAENGIAASVFKDVFANICTNLQRVDDRANLSFREIVDLAVRIYEMVGVKARIGFDILDLPDVLLGGWCDHEQRVRVFKLVAPGGDTAKPIVSERLLSQADFDYEPIGSGKDVFRLLVERHEKSHHSIHINMLRWFKQLIDSREVPSVGGTIQFGEFRDGDFVLRGIIYPLDESSSGKAHWMLSSMDVSRLADPANELGLRPAGGFANPFPDILPTPVADFLSRIPEIKPE